MSQSIAARKIRLIMKLRRSGITESRVLSAIEVIPREYFIPATFHDQAYEDIALPIGLGQTISQPLVVALMTQALDLNDRHKVLEIGTGSGYQAAVLAKLCRRVYTIERHKPLLAKAEERLHGLRISNYTAKAADGMLGWPEQAPFDRIIVTAAARADVPQALLDQLAPEGVMVIPMGQNGSQYLYRIRRTSENTFDCEQLSAVRFVPLLPDVPQNDGSAVYNTEQDDDAAAAG